MIGYVDCDFLLKLTACNLLEEAIAHLGLVKENLRVTDSARYSMGSKRRRAQYTDTVCDRAARLAEELVPISASNHPMMSLQLPDVDVGELVLLCAALATPSCYFLTGDKEFMRALYKHKELKEAQTHFRGCVVCVEQAVLGAIAAKGFDYVKARIVPRRDCDRALKVVFGSGEQSEEHNSVLALRQYISEIEQDCPGLLASII